MTPKIGFLLRILFSEFLKIIFEARLKLVYSYDRALLTIPVSSVWTTHEKINELKLCYGTGLVIDELMMVWLMQRYTQEKFQLMKFSHQAVGSCSTSIHDSAIAVTHNNSGNHFLNVCGLNIENACFSWKFTTTDLYEIIDLWIDLLALQVVLCVD